MEILWFRALISILGGHRAVFSLLLAVILTGIFLGSLAGGMLQRRIGMAVTLYMRAQVFFVVATLVGLAVYDPRTMGLPGVRQLASALIQLGVAPPSLEPVALSIQHIIAMVGLPALMMGFSFPLANAYVQRFEASVGSRSGSLYLANTFGNVVGSLGTGLLLLPTLGTAKSVTLLMAIAGLGVVSLFLSARGEARAEEGGRMPRRNPAIYLGIIGASLVWWISMPPNLLLHRSLPTHVELGGERFPLYESMIKTMSEGINETIAIIDSPHPTLYTNGHSMSGTNKTAQRYMRLFTHIPLLNQEDPSRVLVICFGVGNTLHSASLHSSISRLEIADLSENVLRHASHFSESNRDILEDERVEVYVNDGRQHLRMREPESYDLVTLEPPPITFAGVASLYSVEFYDLVRSRLREGGYLTQWLPVYQISGDVGLSMVRAFMEVFPEGVLLSGHGDELILVGRKGGSPALDLDRLRKNLAREELVLRDLERINAEQLSWLVATFAGSASTLNRATDEVEPITDDLPMMEYPKFGALQSVRVASSLFDLDDIASFCPACYERNATIPELRDLPHLQAALDAYYQSDRFLERGDAAVPESWGDVRRVLASDPCTAEAIRANDYYRFLLAEPLRGLPKSGCLPESVGP